MYPRATLLLGTGLLSSLVAETKYSRQKRLEEKGLRPVHGLR